MRYVALAVTLPLWAVAAVGLTLWWLLTRLWPWRWY